MALSREDTFGAIGDLANIVADYKAAELAAEVKIAEASAQAQRYDLEYARIQEEASARRAEDPFGIGVPMPLLMVGVAVGVALLKG